MGFFDKLKQVKNMVTGGGAVVNVAPANQINDGNEPIAFKISCQVKDADVSVRNVYLKVRAIEEVVCRDTDIARDYDGEIRTIQEDVTNTCETYSTEIQVAAAETLEANETYEWIVEFEVPSNLNGTYRGHNALHEWEVYAGLDVAGNDPDSGWVTFEVKK
ncbi:hypothetical protein [Chondrinema litorale]|uniref:hypothetical protein n=1 Tax=Chondrinema litorale TaxID=2994555 RepID=UPI00254273A1|nr:hypothetical protein [Chondrinema litorale]UZR98697.1 hypothetical protein OQ292_32320 [Chondrinema litorale]